MMRFLKQPSSAEVAKKMLTAIDGFNSGLKQKSKLTPAEKRHLMRLRAVAVLNSDQVSIKKK